MAEVTITGLPNASALTGAERVPMDQGGTTVDATTAAIAALAPQGTMTSVGLVAPTGFSVSGSPVTAAGNITLTYAAGYSVPTTASQATWDTAYTERRQWDGGSTNLDAATGRASLGGVPLLTSTAPSNPAATAAVGTAADAARADHVHQFAPTDLVIPLSGEASNLTVSTVLTIPYWPRAQVLTAVPIWMLNTAPTGAAAQFDIRIGGTSIFSTLPTIAASGTNSTTTTAATLSTAFVNGGQAIAAGSSVTFHVLQIGSTVAGAGLKVALPVRRNA